MSLECAGCAGKWRTLSGQDHWKGLIEPLDVDLRKYLIHYGERAEACYDTFNADLKSMYAGTSKYGKEHFFENVGLVKGNPYKYTVTKFLYATSSVDMPSAFIVESKSPNPWVKKSNWIGYMAVATDEGKRVLGRRDILIAWRGTIDALEWSEDFNFPLVSDPEMFGQGNDKVKVHRGFHSMYTSANPDSKFNKQSTRDQILPELERLLEQYKSEPTSISVTGHSLGAAMATLSGVDIGNRFRKPCMVTTFAYACPRIGNQAFLDLANSLEHYRSIRIRNVPDTVPQSPPEIAGYKDIGEEVVIDTRKSNYVNYDGSFLANHELESAYLHGLAGAHGANGPFKLEVDRDIALVNKFTNYLKDQYLIPDYWWVQRNMGMHQLANGHWTLHDKEDI